MDRDGARALEEPPDESDTRSARERATESVTERVFADMSSMVARTSMPEIGMPSEIAPVSTEQEREEDNSASQPGEIRPAKMAPHPPNRTSNIGDRLFDWITTGFAGLIIGIVLLMLAVLFVQGRTTITKFGLGFFTSTTWDSTHDKYGAATSILGSVYTSLLALLLA